MIVVLACLLGVCVASAPSFSCLPLVQVNLLNTDTLTSNVLTFAKASAVSPIVVLGCTGLNTVSISASYTLRLSTFSVTTTGLTLKLDGTLTLWATVSLSIMTFSDTTINLFLQCVVHNHSGLNLTGVLNAWDNYLVPITLVNTSNDLKVIAFTREFSVSANTSFGSTQFFAPGFQMRYGIHDSSNIWVNVSAVMNTAVTFTSFTFVVIDYTLTQLTWFRFEVNSVSRSQSVGANVIGTAHYSQHCFMAGFNSFSFDNTSLLQFNFTFPTFSITSSAVVYELNISTLSVLRRFCPTTDSLYQPITNQCYSFCPAGYYPTPLYCLACHYTCFNCTSGTACAICIVSTSKTLVGDFCNCMTGFFSNLVTCQSCNSSCLNCSINENNCTACHLGFKVSNTWCVEVCGDGILMILACDDGNLVNGDGCDQLCQIETNYTCINGSPTNPSVCSYNQPFELKFLNSIQNQTNDVQIQLSIFPVLSQLTSLNFSSFFTSSIPVTSISHAYSNGIITLMVSFQQPLHNPYSSLVWTFTPPTVSSYNFMWKPSSVSVPYGSLIIIQYDAAIQMLPIIKIVLIVVEGLSFLGLLLTYRKEAGLQLMMTLQIVTLSTSYIADNWKMINSFSYLQKIGVNGYNSLFNDVVSPIASELPLARMGYSEELFKNLNFMVFLTLCLIAISLVFNIIRFKVGSPHKENLQKIYNYLQFEIIPTLILFNLINLSFGIGVTGYSYASRDSSTFSAHNLAGNLSIMFLCLLQMAVLSEYYRGDHSILISWREEYKESKFSMLHLVIWVMYKFCVGFVMGLAHAFPSSLIALMVMLCIYVTYTCVVRPYRTWILMTNALYNEVVCLTLFIILYLYNVGVIDQVRTSLPIPFFVVLALIAIGALLSAAYGVYSLTKIIRYCLRKPGRTKVQLIRSMDEMKEHYQEEIKIKRKVRRFTRLQRTQSLQGQSDISVDIEELR